MRIWIGAVLVVAALTLDAPVAVAAASGAAEAKAATAKTTDVSARRAYRRYPAYPAYARYPHYPTYYARPVYYRPYPYDVPVPFFLGFGYLPRY